MQSQRHLFQLPEDVHYLNCGYMSPLLKKVEEAGIKGMQERRNPMHIKSSDFFDEVEIARSKFGQLVGCRAEQVAIVPSASYGLKAAINNLPVSKGRFAITVSDEFPSGYYTLQTWCSQTNKELRVIQAPREPENRAKKWNEEIIAAINKDTAAVLISTIHWTDGTLFDLEQIGKRCRETGCCFIVDGTQSVGVLPIDVHKFHIDVLVCAAYKWLLGPYSLGAAYYSEAFNDGTPLEDSWMTRKNASDFSRLTTYTDEYREGAYRYNMGEHSNFVSIPMFNAALDQINEWDARQIQDYCQKLTTPLVEFLVENDFNIEKENGRAKHLFGFSLPAAINAESLLAELQSKKISISLRIPNIRVSTHLFNTEKDIVALIESLSRFCR